MVCIIADREFEQIIAQVHSPVCAAKHRAHSTSFQHARCQVVLGTPSCRTFVLARDERPSLATREKSRTMSAART
jgi:hypothetical protein